MFSVSINHQRKDIFPLSRHLSSLQLSSSSLASSHRNFIQPLLSSQPRHSCLMTSPNSGHHSQEHQSPSSPSPSPEPSDIIDTNHTVTRHQLVDSSNPNLSHHPHPNATPHTSPQQFLSPLRLHNSLRRDVIHHNVDSRTIDRASTVSERSRARHHHPNRASSASMPQLLAEAGIDDLTRSPNHGRQSVTRSDMDSQAESSTRERKRRVDRLQLSHFPHGHLSRSVESPTPSVTPLSPNSIRSGKSRHSSTRRITGESAKAQAAAAVELADQQNLKVITRSMSSYRVVQLLYQTDADLFDAIRDWKERHPDLWVDDAIDAFGNLLYYSCTHILEHGDDRGKHLINPCHVTSSFC